MADPVAMVDLQRAIAELRRLMRISMEARVQTILSTNVRMLEEEYSRVMRNVQQPGPSRGPSAIRRCYDVKLAQYGWGQDDNYVKIFIKLQNLMPEHESKVDCDFSSYSFKFTVKGLGDRNYILDIKSLLGEIIPAKCYFKVKAGSAIVFLAKKLANQWAFLTTTELKSSYFKMPNIQFGVDPRMSVMQLMNMMNQVDNEEVRKHIAKCWLERTGNSGEEVVSYLRQRVGDPAATRAEAIVTSAAQEVTVTSGEEQKREES